MRIARTVLVAGLLAAAAPVPAQQPNLTAEEVFARLGFTAAEQEKLRAGDIVAHAFEELSDKELAITMAVLVPASLSDLLDLARSGDGLGINRDVLAFQTITGDDSFRAIGFDDAEGSEIRKLLQARPESDFNLSADEVERFKALRERFPGDGCDRDSACRSAVNDEYRSVLQGRFHAYQERGLAGIAPYAREGGKTADPAAELRGAAEALQLVAAKFPGAFEAFSRYPAGDQSLLENHFLWIKQKVQDRPTFILAHRALLVRDGIALAVERQFFVGQSYNSLQVGYGLIPQGDRTLVFYLNRTSTDQVAGFMQGTRHSMGRKIMEKEVRKHFRDVLAHLASGG